MKHRKWITISLLKIQEKFYRNSMKPVLRMKRICLLLKPKFEKGQLVMLLLESES